ncbi:multi-sensor hybrid histidine kinase [Marinomonas polaris DSM 16579]|uniref:histidine kinase n=1 Tax=Marinomonas polaris DSM 16579 TaxID=1122206 RepID=A0A1M5BP18_9GAMM|nr:MHYT domain-containing protein [Marinomonas polaris]SHF44150.1 multi-sensor hybrid histidine kinase [Marinomonas polaris DSM 16579]
MYSLNSFFVTNMDNAHLTMGDYNYLLVALSILLASVASFFALHFASIAQHIVIEKYKNIALVSGSFIMAGGIWSMHFVGMLAFNMGHGISYDPLLTALSLIPAILASYITLKRLIRSDLSIWQLLVNGVLVGGGIGAMHYIGMAAMEMDVELKYDPAWFLASLVIAVALAFIALSTHYYVRKVWANLSTKWVSCISALIMGAAISGMHYAGMAGARFISSGEAGMHHIQDSSNDELSFVVAIITLLLSILAANIASQLRYRQLLLEKTASEVRLKTTLDTAVDGIISIDSSGIIKEFNKAATQIFGWQEDDIINQHFGVLFPQKYTDEFNRSLAAFRDTGEVTIAGTDREIHAINKAGHVFPIRLGVGRVDIPDSGTLFVGFITDISTRKSLEETIQKSEKQFSSLIKNIPGASFRCLMDEHWTTLFVSDAIYDVTGWSTSEFYSRAISFAKLVHPDDEKNVASTINEATNTRKSYKLEYRLRHKDGHYVWVLENGSVILNKHGKPEWIDGVILDISQRVEMEDELRQAKAKAEASVESKASFLANMSHEIRTPMNAIIGFSDILLESEISGENKKHLSIISKSARSLLHLLNDILDSAKLEKNKLELDIQPFVLANSVDTVISTLWLQARNKGLELNFHVELEVAEAYLGAEDRIRQVLMNILGNAIKFTEKGHVTLNISKLQDSKIRFSVTDTGIGIPEERLTHIFDPFTQADASMSRRFGGTGLGTSISKQLVTLMGGQIHVTSEIGVGSCFYFDLPLTETEAPSDAKTSQLSIITPKRILLADDVEQNLTLLTILLKRHGHAIFFAKDGIDAVEQFKMIKPDIILMDIQMPKMDGLTATQIIRSYEKENQLARTPIIALTANVLIEDKLDAQQAGMDGFANKPIDIQALITEIARVLNETPTLIDQENFDHEKINRKNLQIHMDKGLSLWNDLPVYITELSRFAETNANLVNRLTIHIDHQEYQEAYALAHAIKGSSGNLALLNISNCMANIERAAQTKDHDQFSKNVHCLASLLAHFFEELHWLIEKYRLHSEMTETDTQNELSTTQLIALLEALILSADSGEVDDDNIALLISNVPQYMKTQAIAASKAISNFEFDSAIISLTNLKALMIQEPTK